MLTRYYFDQHGAAVPEPQWSCWVSQCHTDATPRWTTPGDIILRRRTQPQLCAFARPKMGVFHGGGFRQCKRGRLCFVWCQRCTIVPSFQLGSFPAWLSAHAFQPLFWCLMRIIHHSSLVSLNPPLNPFTPAPSRPLGLSSSCASCHHLQIQRGGTAADAGFFFLSVFSGP